LPPGAELVLISDFAGLQVRDESALRSIGRQFDCRAIRIADPIELESMPPVSLHLLWNDAAANVDGTDPAASTLFSSQLRAWEAFLERSFRRAGIPLETLSVAAEVPGSLRTTTA